MQSNTLATHQALCTRYLSAWATACYHPPRCTTASISPNLPTKHTSVLHLPPLSTLDIPWAPPRWTNIHISRPENTGAESNAASHRLPTKDRVSETCSSLMAPNLSPVPVTLKLEDNEDADGERRSTMGGKGWVWKKFCSHMSLVIFSKKGPVLFLLGLSLFSVWKSYIFAFHLFYSMATSVGILGETVSLISSFVIFWFLLFFFHWLVSWGHVVDENVV